MSLILALLGLVSLNVTIHTGFESSGVFELFDLSYSMLGLAIAYAAYLYFKSLMRPQDPIAPFIVRRIFILSFYIILYAILIFVQGKILQIHSVEELIKQILQPQVLIRILAFAHFCGFLVWVSVKVVQMYLEHKRRIADLFSFNENINLSWQPYMPAVFCILEVGAIFDIGFAWKDGSLHIVSNFCYALFYVTLAFFGVRQPDIYSTIEIAKQKEEDKNSNSQKYTIPSKIRQSLIHGLKNLLEEQKIYLNPDLKLDTVAADLQTNRTYLSTVIKEDFKENFIGLVNKYRIEEAAQLLNDSENKSSLLEIAEKVGFKSLSSFNTFFKRHMGKGPAEYRKLRFENRK